ncbi:hypothetical protein CRP2_gp69 [Roseobacter phage CRP-2]|nr:hypothetical protein CRP2_gp69 [Roseobacter phage CRP-2]
MLRQVKSVGVVQPVTPVVRTQLVDQRQLPLRSANKKHQRRQDQSELLGLQQHQGRKGLRNG